MKTSIRSKIACYGVSALMAWQPFGVAIAQAGSQAGSADEIATLDAFLDKNAGVEYLDAKGEAVDRLVAIGSKKPFYIQPAVRGFKENRVIGVMVSKGDAKIKVSLSAYDLSEGFAQKTFKAGAQVVVDAKDSAEKTILDFTSAMNTINAAVLAKTESPGVDRKVATGGTCIETWITNVALTSVMLFAAVMLGRITVQLVQKKGKIVYMKTGWTAGAGVVIGGAIAGISRLVKAFTGCQDIKGL